MSGNTILVTYDLKGSETSAEYARLIREIELFGQDKVRHPLYSVWLIQTEWSAEQVRDDLIRWIDADDRLLVWDVTRRAAAWRNLSEGDVAWIKATP